MAAYRDYERQIPGKGYVSPWEKRQIRLGKTLLERGQVFISKAKTALKRGNDSQARDWIGELDKSIRAATGERKTQLQKQKERLERKLRA